MLLISDTHLLLRQLTQDTEASFIYEKIGNHFRHYLIDEFQDTSGFQWDNFKPLLENTLAEGRYNLVVGDVKQAIYRWRNAVTKQEEQLLHNNELERLYEVPHGSGKQSGKDKAEGLAILDSKHMLIVFDSPMEAREVGEHGVQADVLELID